jgi:hypothetical protein
VPNPEFGIGFNGLSFLLSIFHSMNLECLFPHNSLYWVKLYSWGKYLQEYLRHLHSLLLLPVKSFSGITRDTEHY